MPSSVLTSSVSTRVGHLFAAVILGSLFTACLTTPAGAQAGAQSGAQAGAQHSGPDDSEALRPLSAAQTALFNTPHLANVTHPETLRYHYQNTGPGGFTDTITVQVTTANADGTRNLAFNYLSGAHHVRFPVMDGFHGNPVFMLALEHDVDTMHEALKLSQAALRNRIRAAFVDAPVTPGSFTLPDGASTPARIVTLEPFAHEERLNRLPSVQHKTYRFVLAEAVPGQVAEIDIDAPADPALEIPALSEKITFAGVQP